MPLDGSELAECVLPHLESIRQGGGVENITFVRVVEPVHLLYTSDAEYSLNAKDFEMIDAESSAVARNYLDRLMSRVKYDGIDVQAEVLRGGRTADMIADYASNNEVDLIIIATHGRSGVSR